MSVRGNFSHLKKDLNTKVANNVRVYELARELGMTNTQVVDLCGTLGIGVKGHSSGMPEPQADRVRRKAEREGLVTKVKEEKPAAKEPAAEKPAAK
ncbi:MAG TPA: translation initiation factor IF-2 N-terminal domain-containing protein, partial [Acidimicrobiales bacterium]|nr:translation initiation factor IF-2 N-terminal domain-containing protein [Acidimicrobiales bacterium]